MTARLQRWKKRVKQATAEYTQIKRRLAENDDYIKVF
jgi:hypothetical protein